MIRNHENQNSHNGIRLFITKAQNNPEKSSLIELQQLKTTASSSKMLLEKARNSGVWRG